MEPIAFTESLDMVRSLEAMFDRWESHQQTCQYESPAYWNVQNIKAAINAAILTIHNNGKEV